MPKKVGNALYIQKLIDYGIVEEKYLKLKPGFEYELGSFFADLKMGRYHMNGARTEDCYMQNRMSHEVILKCIDRMYYYLKKTNNLPLYKIEQTKDQYIYEVEDGQYFKRRIMPSERYMRTIRAHMFSHLRYVYEQHKREDAIIEAQREEAERKVIEKYENEKNFDEMMYERDENAWWKVR